MAPQELRIHVPHDDEIPANFLDFLSKKLVNFS